MKSSLATASGVRTSSARLAAPVECPSVHILEIEFPDELAK